MVGGMTRRARKTETSAHGRLVCRLWLFQMVPSGSCRENGRITPSTPTPATPMRGGKMAVSPVFELVSIRVALRADPALISLGQSAPPGVARGLGHRSGEH